MKSKLIPLALNELLGFVHRSHYVALEPSRLILAFNSFSAAWRFNSPYHQRPMQGRGSQHSNCISLQH
jgi:hypothetical protein